VNKEQQQANLNLTQAHPRRVRQVKSDVVCAEEFSALTPWAQLAIIKLPMVSDKNGTFIWLPRTLKSWIFPFDDFDFESVLQELLDHHFIRKVSVDNQAYGSIIRFNEQQYLNPKEASAPSVYPAPSATGCTGDVSGMSQGCIGDVSGTTVGVGVEVGVSVESSGVGGRTKSNAKPTAKASKRSRKAKSNPETLDPVAAKEKYTNEEYNEFFRAPSAASMYKEQLSPHARVLVPLSRTLRIPDSFASLVYFLGVAKIPELGTLRDEIAARVLPAAAIRHGYRVPLLVPQETGK